MSECQNDCDCDSPSGPHDPDCRALHKGCDDGERMCDKHWRQHRADFAYLRNIPLSAVTGVMSEEEKQNMRDSGHAHLLPDALADQIDMARMREKDKWTQT
jgi:hypothetical protein